MADASIVSTLLPAITALGGVALAQAWAMRQESWRQRIELSKSLGAGRREAVSRLLISLNQAKNATRGAIRETATAAEAQVVDESHAEPWASAFERYIEASLVLPPEAADICWRHLQTAYAWRRASIAGHKDILTGPGKGGHEDLIAALRPWLNPPELSRPSLGRRTRT